MASFLPAAQSSSLQWPPLGSPSELLVSAQTPSTTPTSDPFTPPSALLPFCLPAAQSSSLQWPPLGSPSGLLVRAQIHSTTPTSDPFSPPPPLLLFSPPLLFEVPAFHPWNLQIFELSTHNASMHAHMQYPCQVALPTCRDGQSAWSGGRVLLCCSCSSRAAPWNGPRCSASR